MATAPDPLSPSVRKEWDKYAARRRKDFAACGMVWPEVPRLSDILCMAIMDSGKNKGKSKNSPPADGPEIGM
jgi:hypothetical protein